MRFERLDSLARQIQDMYKPIVRAQRLRRNVNGGRYATYRHPLPGIWWILQVQTQSLS